MSTIANVITHMRVELDDTNSSRWTDTQLLALVKKAIVRTGHIMVNADIPLARKPATITGVALSTEYSLPADFCSFLALYKDSNNTKLNHVMEFDWFQLDNPAASTVCAVMNNSAGEEKLWIKGAPATGELFTLLYYPSMDVSAYTTATTMPWGGKIDYAIADYAKVLAQNVDEMDASFDTQAMSELERSIMQTLFKHGPSVVQRRGWNT